MKTYLYSEAPKLEEEPDGLDAPVEKTDSVASWDTAEELGYDREVLEEAYDREHRANMRLERSGYYGHANCSTSSSYTTSSDQPFYLPRDYTPPIALNQIEVGSSIDAGHIDGNFRTGRTSLRLSCLFGPSHEPSVFSTGHLG